MDRPGGQSRLIKEVDRSDPGTPHYHVLALISIDRLLLVTLWVGEVGNNLTINYYS